MSEALGVPPESVTLNIELGPRNKRSLLSSVSLTYTASVTSGMASDIVLDKLNSAIAEGTYLESVKEKSGLPISSMTRLALADVTPTATPVSEPTAAPVALTGTLPILRYTTYPALPSLNVQGSHPGYLFS